MSNKTALDFILSGKPATSGPRRGSTYVQYEPEKDGVKATIGEFKIVHPSGEVFRVGAWNPTVDELLMESWGEWDENDESKKIKPRRIEAL